MSKPKKTRVRKSSKSAKAAAVKDLQVKKGLALGSASELVALELTTEECTLIRECIAATLRQLQGSPNNRIQSVAIKTRAQRRRLTHVAEALFLRAVLYPKEFQAKSAGSRAVELSYSDYAFLEFGMTLAIERGSLSSHGRKTAERLRDVFAQALLVADGDAPAEAMTSEAPIKKGEVQVTLRRDLCWLLGRCAAYAAMGEALTQQGNRVATDLGSFLKSAAASRHLSSFHFETSVPPIEETSGDESPGRSAMKQLADAFNIDMKYVEAFVSDNEGKAYEPTQPAKLGDVVSVLSPAGKMMEQVASALGIDQQRLRNFVANEHFIKDHGASLLPTEEKEPGDKFNLYGTLRRLHKSLPVLSYWHKARPVYVRLSAQDWLIASSCIDAVIVMLEHVTLEGRQTIKDVFDADNLERIRATLAQSAISLTQRHQDPKPSPITPAPSPQEAQNPSTSPNPEPSAPGTTQTSSHPQNAALRVSQVSSAEEELRKRAGTPSAAGLTGPFGMGTNAHAQSPGSTHAQSAHAQSGSRDKPKGVGGTEAKYMEAKHREAARRVFTRNLTDAEREKIAKDGLERHFVGCTDVFRDEMAKLVADWKLEQGVKAARTRFEQMTNAERAEARHAGVTTFFKREEYESFEVLEMHKLLEMWAAQCWFNASTNIAKENVLEEGVEHYFGKTGAVTFRDELERLLKEWVLSRKHVGRTNDTSGENKGLSATVDAHLEFERMGPTSRINAWLAGKGRYFASKSEAFHDEMHELLRVWIELNTRMVEGKLEVVPEWVTKFVDSLPVMVVEYDGAMVDVTFRASSPKWAPAVKGLGKTKAGALLDLRRNIIDSVLKDAKNFDVVCRESFPSIAQCLYEETQKKVRVYPGTPLQVAADDA